MARDRQGLARRRSGVDVTLRNVAVAIALVGLSCTRRQISPTVVAPTEPQVTAPPSAAATNYWFSQSQKDTLVSLSAINSGRFVPMFVNGVEYTECQNAAQPIGRFRDYVLVAQTNSGPCGRNAGQWE